jgi:hypothetical protein
MQRSAILPDIFTVNIDIQTFDSIDDLRAEHAKAAVIKA